MKRKSKIMKKSYIKEYLTYIIIVVLAKVVIIVRNAAE